ncbi:alpha/beta hydrolase [Pantoea sp. BAV 3049]|uniref:alpha/beta hydrolase n=1 Tax=Pantoea sp. BAV 3049 TaxID=2654188 RepID=UPI00131D4D1A|nr:alpha/beta hydrolase [Pantoea sp. BAV 3049]
MKRISIFFAVTCVFLLTGCKSSSIVIATKVMNNDASQANAQYSKRFADNNIRRSLIIETDVFYGPLKDNRLDVVYPQSLVFHRLPVVVLVHGGGWVGGNKESMLPYARLIAAEGYLVVNVEYTRVPAGSFPQPLFELNQAVEYVRNPSRWPADMSRVFLSGDSAGANIVSTYAALLASTMLQQQLELIPSVTHQQLKGIIVHSGVYDLSALYMQLDDENILLRWAGQNVIAEYSNESPPSDKRLKEMSALPWLNALYPPVYISATENDMLTKSQTLPFIALLEKLNVPVCSQIYLKEYEESLTHDFNVNLRFQASQSVLAQSLRFLQKYANQSEEN